MHNLYFHVATYSYSEGREKSELNAGVVTAQSNYSLNNEVYIKLIITPPCSLDR